MTTLVATLVLIVIAVGCAFRGWGYWAWVIPAAGGLGWWSASLASPLFGTLTVVLVAMALVFGLPTVRRAVVSRFVMRRIGPLLPVLGDTERIALEAGTVWWDRDLFSGAPDWRRLLQFASQSLSAAEQAFLDGPVEELCAMLDQPAILRLGDLPPNIWKFLKRHRFFGLIIPESFGGLGFSAAAHSAVISKIGSRSTTAAVTVMVPNSLGPAELLLHYGTDEQKARYLPRLATGEEIPCFALTGPEAGSDAAATQSVGIVSRGRVDGEDVLGIRLNWHKRYITLGPVATLIGLAFRLRDPDHLIGNVEDLGITVALIPADLPGIEIGARHDPMGVPFQNGPNRGHDVFVPVEAIIGGQSMAGHGWRMLMESLAAGRSISLPALAVASAQLATRSVGAYATVREQFNIPIGRFEGVEEPLARIGGLTYLMRATSTLTAAAVDAGERPSVLSAIAKAYLTEAMRQVLNDAMDIQAGAAICRGPRNILAQAYQAVPIAITVEGANILTRTMIIYGQGAIRCHPFVQAELQAVAEQDVARFDRALFGHVNHVCRSAARAALLGLTNGRLVRVPVGGHAGVCLRRLTRLSAAFALVSDAAMGTLGGQLKRREKISGRLADALAWLYLCSAAVKKFVDDGQPAGDLPFLRWSCAHALYRIETALSGVLANLPARPVAWLLRALVFPIGRWHRPPLDRTGTRVARALLEDRDARLRLTAGMYIPPPTEPGLGRLEAALDCVVAARDAQGKIKAAITAGRLDRSPKISQPDRALAAKIIDAAEHRRLIDANRLRSEVIQVDAFDPEEFALRQHIGAREAHILTTDDRALVTTDF